MRVGRLLIWMIRGYRTFVSPLLPPSCRYQPTCSEYAMQAIEQHGALRGSWLAVKRVGRCHPFRKGGFDPVPPLGPATGREQQPGADDDRNAGTGPYFESIRPTMRGQY